MFSFCDTSNLLYRKIQYFGYYNDIMKVVNVFERSKCNVSILVSTRALTVTNIICLFHFPVLSLSILSFESFQLFTPYRFDCTNEYIFKLYNMIKNKILFLIGISFNLISAIFSLISFNKLPKSFLDPSSSDLNSLLIIVI